MSWFQRQQARHQQAQARTLRFGLTIIVQDGEIRHGRDRIPLAGTHATIETAGEVEKRVTLTRWVLAGPLALALRKKQDSRQLLLIIENQDANTGVVVSVDPDKHQKALEFAAQLNALAAQA